MTPKQIENAASRIRELEKLQRIAERIDVILKGGDSDDTCINITFGRSPGMYPHDAIVLTDSDREDIKNLVTDRLREHKQTIASEIKQMTPAELVKTVKENSDG